MTRPYGRPPLYDPDTAEAWRQMHASGMSARRIAAATGVHKSVILRHVRGEIRHHDAAWVARVTRRAA